MNSLGLAFLLILIAVLFAVGQGRAADVRRNQCDAVRADVTERTIIVRQTRQPNELTRYWRRMLLPQLRERFDRVDCPGRLPRIPNP